MKDDLLALLACPRDKAAFRRDGNLVRCAHGHEYSIYDGIPVLLRDDVKQTGWWSDASLAKARNYSDGASNDERARKTAPNSEGIAEHVQQVVGATCGNLYKHLVGKLESYPIPDLRLHGGNDRMLLDIGCNWGRWSIAAARKGYRVVGMDPNLDAVLAAREIARAMGVSCSFIVGDARYLPIQKQSFDVVFSYSVLQHLSKTDVKLSLACIAAVLKLTGFSFIQMPNRFGMRSTYHLLKRRFSQGADFDVRYWSPSEVRNTFEQIIGPTDLCVDGFFGLGIQPSDIHLLPIRLQTVVKTSEVLRKLSERIPFLLNVADSLYARSRPE